MGLLAQIEKLYIARRGLLTPDEAKHIEGIRWGVVTTVEKWEEERGFRMGARPDEVLEFTGNLLTTAGVQRLGDQLIGATTAPYSNGNTRLGVGNSSTPFAVGQTDLQGASKLWQPQDATYPQRSTNDLIWKSTFASGDANFAWEEWGIDRGTTASSTATAPMLNRKVQAMGTKSSGTWVLTATITPS